MISFIRGVVLSIALMAAMGTTGGAQAAITWAGTNFVDLDATGLPIGPLATWANAGTLGAFNASGAPAVGLTSGVKAVAFNGSTDFFRGDFAPAGLIGPNPTTTIEVWVYNPAIASEETVVAWGRRFSADGHNMSFNYGSNAAFGSVGHWGWPDTGWNGSPAFGQWHHLVYTHDGAISRVYADGRLREEENHAGALNTQPARINLAAQNLNDNPVDPGVDGGLRGSLAIAKVRIHDGTLTAAQVRNNFLAEAAAFGATAGLPALVHRYSFSESGGAGTTLIDSVGGAHATIVDVGANNASVGGGQVTLTGGAKADSDYVALPGGLVQPLTNLTIETWATPLSVQNWSRVFDVNNGANTDGTFILSWTRGTANNTQRFERGGAFAFDGSEVIALGQEHHIVATWEAGDGTGGGNRASWYLDGRLIATVNSASAFPANQADAAFWLGRSAFNDSTANASYNEMRMYSVALKPNQVQQNFLLGPDAYNLAAARLTPIGDWSFNRDANNNPVNNGQAVPGGGANSALLKDDSGNDFRGRIFEQPHYRTYNPAELAGRVGGGDGFALATGGGAVGEGYVYFDLSPGLSTNSDFTVWARVKRLADLLGTEDEFLFSRPGRWDLAVNSSGQLDFTLGGLSGTTGTPINVGAWYDVALAFDENGANDTVNIYVDGVLAGTFAGNASFDLGDWFHVGAGPGGSADFFGLFDRVMFWNEALSAAAIAGLSVPEPATLWLMAGGGVGLAVMGARRRRQRA